MSFFRHAFRSLSNVSRPLLISGSSIFGVAAAIVFTNDNVFEIVNVRGESMAPTLSANYYETGECDEVLVKKYNPLHDLQRGDVVCFWSPFSADQYVIKRVVALEDDEVIIETKRVRAAMGKTLDSRGSSKVRRALEAWEQRAGNWEEEGRVELENDTGRLKKFKTRVPFGHIWVEGDNWRSTQDSNTYGPISKSLVTGKALYVCWPLSKFGEKPWEKTASKTVVRAGKPGVPEQWEDLFG